jgi:hypothetical protein
MLTFIPWAGIAFFVLFFIFSSKTVCALIVAYFNAKGWNGWNIYICLLFCFAVASTSMLNFWLGYDLALVEPAKEKIIYQGTICF